MYFGFQHQIFNSGSNLQTDLYDIQLITINLSIGSHVCIIIKNVYLVLHIFIHTQMFT